MPRPRVPDGDDFAALFAPPAAAPVLRPCGRCGKPTPECELSAYGKCEACWSDGCPQVHRGESRLERVRYKG